jgi:hypothetical protein
MLIELLQPHEKQAEIVSACLDESIFFIVAIIGRQFGKTTIAENLAIYWSLNEPNSVVYWVSPTDSQAQKVYKEIMNSIIESGCIASKKMPKGDTEIVFTNGSKILFRSAASEDSLRGQSVNYMILDEAAFIKRDTVETILLPMLNVKGRKCLFISTPKGKNYLYEYFLNGQKLDKWKSMRYSTYDSPFANEDLINMFKETLAPKLFQQEVEAEFVDSSSIFNNINDVMCLDTIDGPQPDERYFAGIDIGFINDASVMCIINKDGNLVKYYRWTNIEAPELMNEITEINKKWKFQKIMIESNNQGLTIYQDLKRRMNNIEAFSTTSKSKPEIINRLIHLFNIKDMKLVIDEYLRIELEAFVFKQNVNGNIKFMADSGFHDDCVISLAIARWCYENKNYGSNQFRIRY